MVPPCGVWMAFRSLMTRHSSSTPTGASSSFAKTCNLIHSSTACLCHSSSPWIIDFGASDHSSSPSVLFSKYTLLSGHEKIHIADGTFSPIAEKGVIHATPSLHYLLCYMFLVSHLIFYLLVGSLVILTVVTFFPSHCDSPHRGRLAVVGRSTVFTYWM